MYEAHSPALSQLHPLHALSPHFRATFPPLPPSTNVCPCLGPLPGWWSLLLTSLPFLPAHLSLGPLGAGQASRLHALALDSAAFSLHWTRVAGRGPLLGTGSDLTSFKD